MAEPCKEFSTTPPSDGAAFNQADIDALMSDAAAAGDTVNPALSSLVTPIDTQEITQADIDALTNAAAGGAASTAGIEEEWAAPQTPSAFATQRFELPDLGPATLSGVDVKRITMLNDVKLRVKIELGRTRMLVEDVLKLGEGSVVELDKLAGDPVDVYANDRLIARGEVLVLNESFCVRINEVLSRDPHRVSV
jgi:flagellar motor switch protein FliN/FliY